MDGKRFDSLARTWGERMTRRRIVGGLFGVAAGAGMLAAPEVAGAASRTCRRPGDKCVRTSQCCGGSCQLSGRRSRIRTCVCPAGLTACRGECVELGTVEHCLACGDACGDGQDCCASGCTDLGTQDNCTACGDACNGASDEACAGADGCQHACFGHDTKGEDGYITTDNPPRYFAGNNYDQYTYTRHVTNNPNNNTVTPCQTSDDCTGCATVPPDLGRVRTGCGCLKLACGTDVSDNGLWLDLAERWTTHFCSATYSG